MDDFFILDLRLSTFSFELVNHESKIEKIVSFKLAVETLQQDIVIE